MMAFIEFDPAKSAKNRRERGIGFERFADMDLETAISVEDARKDYGERRLRVLGHIEGQLHAAVRGGPRNSDSLLRWDPDPGEGVWHATEETELSC